MKNCNKEKHTCGDSVSYATCVAYETTLPDFSEIDDCADLDATTTELYELVGDIREQIDLTELAESCLEYIKDAEERIVVKNALLKHQEEICNLKEKIEELENTPLCNRLLDTNCLDLKCLTDACSNSITTYGELFQALINNACPTP